MYRPATNSIQGRDVFNFKTIHKIPLYPSIYPSSGISTAGRPTPLGRDEDNRSSTTFKGSAAKRVSRPVKADNSARRSNIDLVLSPRVHTRKTLLKHHYFSVHAPLHLPVNSTILSDLQPPCFERSKRKTLPPIPALTQ